MYNFIMLNSGISVYGSSAPSKRSDADMFSEAAIEVERVFQNESLTDAFKNGVAEDSPFNSFLKFAVMMSFIFGLWFIGNSIRAILEQRKIEEEEERKELEQDLEISRLCHILEKAERNKMHEEFMRGRKGKLKYKRRTLRKSRKQNLIKRSLATLWNKLNQIRSEQVFKAEKIVYHYDELKLSSDENADATKIQSCSTPEISAFVPKFHSTDRYENKLDSKMSFPSDISPNEMHDQSEPLTLEMLKPSKTSDDLVFESRTERFAADDLPSINAFGSNPVAQRVAAPKVMNESYAIGGDCFNISKDSQTSPKDSGFQDTNESGQIKSFLKPEEDKMNKILHEVEQYNLIKNVELCGQIQQAQNQVKSEMGDLKSTFQVPPESVEITQSQILDCALLQTRKKMIHHVEKRMKVVRNEIEDTKKKSLKFSTTSKKTTDDSLTRLMQSLVWQQRHEERLVRARSKIISSVKSAMETRFRGMALKNKNGTCPDAKNFCYDCAIGRHKLFFIDGVDGCDIEGEDKILREADGFNKDCTVVKLINSWYKELELKRCGSTKVRADKMETLLNKVLKEMFLKRYYERGQLISQKYLTVSSTLAQFVFISPKSSIPPSDD